MVDKETLAGLELFVGLPDRALEEISALTERKRYAPGDIIFSPEQASDRAFLLLKGSVRLTVHATSLPHPVTIVSLETPGQAFGFSTIIGQTHHNSSAEAATEVEAVAVDGPRFLAYLEKEPETGYVVMSRVARALSRRLATLRRHLLQTIVDYELPKSTTPEN